MGEPIQRWRMEPHPSGCGVNQIPDRDGDYVHFADLARVQAELEVARAEKRFWEGLAGERLSAVKVLAEAVHHAERQDNYSYQFVDESGTVHPDAPNYSDLITAKVLARNAAYNHPTARAAIDAARRSE